MSDGLLRLLRPQDYAESLVRSSLDMIISVDLDRRIIEFNPAAEAAFGYRRDEMLGKPVDVLYADPVSGSKLSRQAALARFQGEVRNRRKNGETFFCYVSACPLHDAQGNVIGLMGISRDITEQKAQQEALRRAHDELARWNRELEEKVRQRTAAVRAAYDDTLDALVLALDARESATAGHSRRVAMYCVYLAQDAGMSVGALEPLYRGALLHDIGKIGVPDAVLLKPGKLTPEEREVIETHVNIGGRLLGEIGYLANSIAIPQYHHERWDGTGYSAGLAGEEIPLAARIFAIVDVYDALRSDRPYKSAMDHAAASRTIVCEAGRHFDPAVVAKFQAVSERAWESLTEAAQRAERFDDVLTACRRARETRRGASEVASLR